MNGCLLISLQPSLKTKLKRLVCGNNIQPKIKLICKMSGKDRLAIFLSRRPRLLSEVIKEAAFSLAEAKFTTGDFNQVVLKNVKIRTKKDNVTGVTLPVFESYTDGVDSYELAGLARGGQQLVRLEREEFYRLKKIQDKKRISRKMADEWKAARR